MRLVSCVCLLPVEWPWTDHLTSQISVHSSHRKNLATGLGNLDCKWSVGMAITIGIIPSPVLKKVTPGVQNPQLPGELPFSADNWGPEEMGDPPACPWDNHSPLRFRPPMYTSRVRKADLSARAGKAKFFERTEIGLLWCERGELSF